MFKKSLFIFGLISSLSTSAVLAADVNISESLTLPLTIGSETVNFTVTPVGFTSFSVSTDSINFTTSSDKVTLRGPSNISFGDATDCTIPGLSIYIVPDNTTVTVTPTKPATTAVEYKNTCDGRLGGGGTPPTSSSPGGGSPVVTTKPDAAKKDTTAKATGPFNDVPGNLKQNSVDAILSMSDLMKNTYTFGKSYQPSKAASFAFMASMSLALNGSDCGGAISEKRCIQAAAKLGLIAAKDVTKVSVKLGEAYSMLLRAAGIDLLDASAITKAQQCKDVAKSDPYYSVVATAKKYGIAYRFAGGKCKPKAAFSRATGALLGSRTLSAKK